MLVQQCEKQAAQAAERVQQLMRQRSQLDADILHAQNASSLAHHALENARTLARSLREDVWPNGVEKDVDPTGITMFADQESAECSTEEEI